MRDKRFVLVISIAAFGCLLAALLSICVGAVWISPFDFFGGFDTAEWRIFRYARLPRTLACLMAGAGLSTSGAVIQGVLANRLASPGVIGVNAGAGLGVTLCCAFGAVSGWTVAGASFAGALAAVMTVAFAAQKTYASRSAVILGGVAVNSFLTAISEGIITLYPEIGAYTADFRTGGFSGVSDSRLIPASVMIIIALAAVFTLSNELDVLSMGEDMAQGLGLPVKKMRTVFLALAALLAGASVSFAGLLGFVGLIVPNMAKRLVGGESRRLLPLCAVGGAMFVTLCDCAAKSVFSPYEIPTGIVMSAIGAPFFIFLLFKLKGGHSRG
ncbi:MAG: iron ABC transporter permease [Ruminococcaceae bacterium]|nr:iron ABC transporter permease [Oscillospiraceae bacterium]